MSPMRYTLLAVLIFLTIVVGTVPLIAEPRFDPEQACTFAANLDGIDNPTARFWRAFCALKAEVQK
jgi:hypothetical protein